MKWKQIVDRSEGKLLAFVFTEFFVSSRLSHSKSGNADSLPL